MSSRKIIVVTGANKGVGYGIIRQLLLQTNTPLLIYLTSRDAARGKSAVSKIHESSDLAASLKSSDVAWHALDITSTPSIETLVDFVKTQHGKLDVLVNNAGIATKGDTFNKDVVESTLACNYTATQTMCSAFLPIMQHGGRIVNVSSMAGKLHKLTPDLQSRFRGAETLKDVDTLMHEFASGVQNDQPPSGWPKAGYAVSKMGVTAMTRLLAKTNSEVLINAVCPGYVNTDMTSGKGHKTIDEGAMTPTFAAIGDIGDKTGEFFEDCKVVQW